MDEYKILTIREYAALKDVPEPTVRSRIRLGKIQTVPHTTEDGKEVHGIRVKAAELSSDDQTDQAINHQPSSPNNQMIMTPSSPGITLDYQLMIEERDEEIRTLRRNLDDLRNQLETERVKNARIEGELKRLEDKDKAIDAQQTTIESQKTTIDALNNERIVITHQLQKYRTEETQESKAEDKKSRWWPW